jgi:hypothetical protein
MLKDTDSTKTKRNLGTQSTLYEEMFAKQMNARKGILLNSRQAQFRESTV